jgi:[histone H3]-lysine36 N-dimethyltransferase SETMAR
MIFYDFKVGLNEKDCFKRICQAFPSSHPSFATIFRWFREFKREKVDFEDDKRSGRPSTASSKENVEKLRVILREDPHATYQYIEKSLNIGSAAVFKLLHEELKVRKLCSRWVPHELTEDQMKQRVSWCQEMLQKFASGTSKQLYDVVTGDETWIYQFDPQTKRQSSVWVFENEEPPTKVKRPRSVGKRMVATFFSKTGHVATVTLEEGKTVTANWYTQICLPEVIKNLKERRPRTGTRGILLHHDNAPAHKASKTMDFLKENQIHLVGHPPYSPDLAPCDFYLFPKVKESLRGIKFKSPDAALERYLEVLEDLSPDDWKKIFESWFQRMEKCIECNGTYFEKK